MTNTKKNTYQALGFWILFISLVLIFVLLCGLTVQSNSKVSDKLNRYYSEQSKELTKRTRSFLAGKGFQNSGVTVTRCVEADGNATFTITVHHDLINVLDQTDKVKLLKEMEDLSFQDEHCSFVYELLQET